MQTSSKLADLVRNIVEHRGGMSNALLVSARESESGRPLAVFGPQTGYFGPQPLMEMDIHGPTIDSRGAVVVGTPWVALGRGEDYAWSATSQSNDVQDVYALDLCEQDGSKPTIDSMSYVFRGQCLPIEVIEKRVSWQSNLVDSTPSGSATLRALRTKMGIGIARATIKGKPVLYTRLRFSYGREVDETSVAVRTWNYPDAAPQRARLHALAARVPAAFNWFYVDDKDIAYMAGGRAADPAEAREPRPADPLPAEPRVEGLQPGHARLPAAADLAPAAGGQPVLHRQLEQQAGTRLPDGRRQLGVRLALPLADARGPREARASGAPTR